jgi:signal transduction histidine kinase
MLQSYAEQLRNDSTVMVTPFTTAVFVIGSLIVLAGSATQAGLAIWSIWLALIVSIAAAFITRRLLNRERQVWGALFYVGSKLFILTCVMIQFWQPGSSLPFLFGYFIVISSMLVDLTMGFFTWGLSIVLMALALHLGDNFTWHNFSLLLPAIGINLLLAVASFLSAVDWKMSVESVSELQNKAQIRRDELFKTQEELSSINAKLNYLNKQLDEARQAAVDERDMRARFMNNVSHELRTPLNAIVNFAYILAQGARGPLNEDQVDYLSRIQQSGRHLLDVLNDLLDLARIESGQFTLHLELADLRDVCEEAMNSAAGLIIERDIELKRDYPEEWPWVQVDKMRFKQVLINLLGNAAKYTDEGSITLRVRPEDDRLLISIIDTGAGIAPEYHEAIFQEFRQVDDTPARRRVGTGLGLPIARHLIERHGGQIALESVPGQGSNFTIILPLPQASLKDEE